MPLKPIEISVYAYSVASKARPVGDSRRSHSGLLRGAVAATICLLTHGLLLRSVMFSAGALQHATKDLPARVSVANASDQEDMQWVALDPNALSDPARQPPDLPTRPLKTFDMRKALTEALLVSDIDLPPTPDATVADAGRLSKLYGQYVSQIAGRIERAWLRPRTPIGADQFSCQVHVTQDATGHVQEVMLEHCNGDTRWQVSLVKAIQYASPLPAPPDPDVFSEALHLAFTAESYSHEAPAELYEPEAVSQAAEAEMDSKRADTALQHIGEPGYAKISGITISGDHKSVQLQSGSDALSPAE